MNVNLSLFKTASNCTRSYVVLTRYGRMCVCVCWKLNSIYLCYGEWIESIKPNQKYGETTSLIFVKRQKKSVSVVYFWYVKNSVPFFYYLLSSFICDAIGIHSVGACFELLSCLFSKHGLESRRHVVVSHELREAIVYCVHFVCLLECVRVCLCNAIRTRKTNSSLETCVYPKPRKSSRHWITRDGLDCVLYIYNYRRDMNKNRSVFICKKLLFRFQP